MKRILPDTNIYGLLARDLDRIKLVERLVNDKIMIVYGNKTIRDELRDISKKIRFNGKSLRVDILNLYDQIVKERILKIDKSVIETADNYYKAYREFGGSKSKSNIIADFRIVACASVKNRRFLSMLRNAKHFRHFYEMDIVVSSDEKSMLTENALRAYKLVNSIAKKRTPKFIDFIGFKNYLRGGKSNEFV